MNSVLGRKPKIDPAAVYVAIVSFAGESFVISAGDRLLGTNPHVMAFPHLFAPDGTDEVELGRLRVALEGEPIVPTDPFGPILPGVVPPERRVRATRDVWAGAAIAVWAGTVLDNRDPVVKRAPDAFEPAPDYEPAA